MMHQPQVQHIFKSKLSLIQTEYTSQFQQFYCVHYGQRQHRTHQHTIIKTHYIHFKTATILLSHSTLNYIVSNDYHHSLRATTLTLSYQCNQCCQFMLFEATFRLFLVVQHCKPSLQLAGLREHKVLSV